MARLLDAPINVGDQQKASEVRDWIKQADQISHVDRDALERAAKKKKSRQDKKARRDELKYIEKARSALSSITTVRELILSLY